LAKGGQLELSKAEYRQAISRDSAYAEAYRALAAAALQSSDAATLQYAAGEMIRLQPASPDGYGLRGLAKINAHRYSDAAEDIRRAIAIAPGEAVGYAQMGNLRLVQGQYVAAIGAYEAALKRNGNSIDALRGLASAYLARKEPAQAVSRIRAQIAVSPKNSRFYGLLGTVLLQAKLDRRGAEEAYRKSVELDAHNTESWHRLCELLASQGRLGEAIESGQQNLSANGSASQPDNLILLGDLYAAAGNWKSAQGAFARAVEVDTQNAKAEAGLAGAMLHTGGDLNAAFTLAMAAAQQLPESPRVQDTLGRVYYQKGSYQLAVKAFLAALQGREAERLTPSAEIRYHLALAYKKTDQVALARDQLARAMEEHPDSQTAADLQRELATLR